MNQLPPMSSIAVPSPETVTYASGGVLLSSSPEFDRRIATLANLCFDADESCRWDELPVRPVAGSRLVQFSSFGDGTRLSCLDAQALAGARWLFALELTQQIATHFCDQLESRIDEALVLEYWRDAVFLADCGELLARVARRSSPMRAWLSGLFLGIANTTKVYEAFQYCESQVTPATPLEIAKLLTSMGGQQLFALPTPGSAPNGAWNVLRTAQRLLKDQNQVSWASQSLSTVEECPLPSCLQVPLSLRMPRERAKSYRLANACWCFARHQRGLR